MTLFHAQKCCRLASKHDVSDGLCSSSCRQFLIYSTFVFYNVIFSHYYCFRIKMLNQTILFSTVIKLYLPHIQKLSSGNQRSQTTTTFCLINVSGRSTYSSVHCRRQSVSCCSHSSEEKAFIARHCCPLSLDLLLSS